VIAIIIGVGGYKWYEKNKNYKQEVDRLSRKYTSFIRDFDAKVDPLVLENTLKSIEKTAKEKDINTITYKNRSINLIDEIKSKRKRIENMKKTLPTVNVGEKWDKIQRLQDEGECFEILYMLSDLELELSKFSLSDQEKYKQYKENARSQKQEFFTLLETKYNQAISEKKPNILLPDLEKKLINFQSNEKTTSFFKNEIEKLQEYKTKIESLIPVWKQEQEEAKKKKSLQYAQTILDEIDKLCLEEKFKEAREKLQQEVRNKDLQGSERELLRSESEKIQLLENSLKNFFQILNKKIPKDTISLYINSRWQKIQFFRDPNFYFPPLDSKAKYKKDEPLHYSHLNKQHWQTIIERIWELLSTDEERLTFAIVTERMKLYEQSDKFLQVLVDNNKNVYQRFQDQLHHTIQRRIKKSIENIQNLTKTLQGKSSSQENPLQEISLFQENFGFFNHSYQKELNQLILNSSRQLYGTPKAKEYFYVFQDTKSNLTDLFERTQGNLNPKIENGVSYYSRGAGYIKSKRFYALSGFLKFQHPSDKFVIALYQNKKINYTYELDATGQFSFKIYSRGILKSEDLKTNLAEKWVQFAFYVRKDKLIWYVNNKSWFEFKYNPRTTIDEISIEFIASKPIILDNIYLVYDKAGK